MNGNYITIFTPTYNRANKLGDLYKSLITQTNKNFEWLIIDDGSTDNTNSVIQSFINQNMIKIIYIYKNNEGKSIAINKAAEYAKGNWIFIVDSDDKLTEDAIETIFQNCEAIKNNPQFAGVAGLRGNNQKEVWSSFNPHQIERNKGTSKIAEYNELYIDATPIEYRYSYNISGDRAEVIRTEVLKKYPFPKFENENFMPESYLWFSLSRDGYKFRWFNKIIYITEYLEDGLTKNGKYISIKNSKSKCYLENFFLTLEDLPYKIRLKSGINYFRYGIFTGYSWSELYKKCNDKKIGIVGSLVAWFYKVK